MPNIFTRPNLKEIIANEEKSPEEKVEAIYSLYGRSIDDGFVSKGAAKAAETAAIEAAKQEWEKNAPKPDVMTSPEYVALKGEYDAFREKEAARNSDDFKEVKPKYFDTVYGKIDRSEGAKPVSEQIATIKKDFEEMFVASAPNPKPAFGAPTGGTMPTGAQGAVDAFTQAWGIPKAQN